MAAMSPMMKQYFEIKERYEGTILLFRLGDFYEMFFDDAITASKALELTLTGRDCGQEERAPMCGVPYHSAEGYVNRLIEQGYKVAICEQMEDAADAKGIVRRDVTRVITAGTVTNAAMLDEKSNNYLCCAFFNSGHIGMAFADITTGDFYATECDFDRAEVMSCITGYSPREIICNTAFLNNTSLVDGLKQRLSCSVEGVNDYYFEEEFAAEKITAQFADKSAELSVNGHLSAYIAVGVMLEYLANTQMCSMPHINGVQFYTGGQFMDIDFFTRRNLEITSTMRENKRKGSLLWVLDDCKTSMGARMMKMWLEKPLTSCAAIQKRLSAVNELFSNSIKRSELRHELSSVMDIERLIGRVVTGSANCRDLQALGWSLKPLPAILDNIEGADATLLDGIKNDIDLLDDICGLIERAIVDSPPLTIKEGGIIRDAFDENVDIYRKAMAEGKEWIASVEQKERENTGIKNLKIGYNKVFGYYIEISKSNIQNAPDTYIRKQTLANCERYITGELKEIENKILGAEERICQLEYSIFCEVREKTAAAYKRIQKTAKALATLDSLCSFAEVAAKNNYAMPHVDVSGKITIKNGRHPVAEKMLAGSLFVPNDTALSLADRVSIITGPNMAGKSTYMRQVALIVLMAQVGSFVPAESADIGIVDKIFTRVGASDDIATGQSTFMVEMTEVANILDNATSNSLLILDEIGRGTSTFDGLSIAWAVVEYVADKKKLGAKTLFATHYHELTDLEDKIDGVKNYCTSVKKRGDDITFLRKIVRGGADDSYGIEVAKLAGVKKEVIKRAKEIVTVLEDADINKTDVVRMKKKLEIKSENSHINNEPNLLSFANNEIVDELKNIDVTTVTPIEALNMLDRLKKKASAL